MQHRNFPVRRSDSILLYGFGLALALSLVFNGFLLFEQSRQRSHYEYAFGNSGYPEEDVIWQQKLSDCKRDNLQKDSLIRRLEKAPDIPSGQAGLVQGTAPKQ